MIAIRRLRLVSVAVAVALALASCTGSEPDSALTDRPDDWAKFPVGEVINELVGTNSEIPEVTTQIVVDCLGDRGLNPSLIEQYQQNSTAAPSAIQVLGVASGFGSIADLFEPLPPVLPGTGQSQFESAQLELALNGGNGQKGCVELVQERGDNPVTIVLDVLGSDLATLKVGYQTDERVRTFWQSWAICMSDQGYTAANLNTLRSQFAAEANEILSSTSAHLPSKGGVLGILVSEEKQQKLLDDAAEQTKSVTVAFEAREQAAASASSECGANPTDSIPQELISVRIEYEQAMLGTNQAKIETLLQQFRS